MAKERASTAALLQAAAAAQQPASQHRLMPSFDSRTAQVSRSRHLHNQASTDQEVPFTRSRLGGQGRKSLDMHNSNSAMPAGHAVPRFAHTQKNGNISEATSQGLGPVGRISEGLVSSQSSHDLREGFRQAVGVVSETPRLSHAKSDDCSINNVLPHVASWGNLSNHSNSSNSGLHNGVRDNTSRGLPTFEPISTPAGLFNSNGNTTGDKGSFPSYLASIWSSDAKSASGSPNSHFEQPSLLNNHQ